MSGVAGGDRIEAPHVRPTTDNYVSNVLSKFPGFTSADISGSFNYGNKEDFGDIDLIVHIKGDDKKNIKQQLADYFASLPDSTIVPFKSSKYKGRKYYNAGELVSVLFPQSSYSDKTVQIDNIVAITPEESIYKRRFLDYPAEKQGLMIGLIKTIMLEEQPEAVFNRMGINAPPLEENQEYEFNLSGVRLELRIVTLGENYKELNRKSVWQSMSWNDVVRLLQKYDLNAEFEDLVRDVKLSLANPRSKHRIKGMFNSLVTIKSGEVGTAKAERKATTAKLIDKTFSEGLTFINNITESRLFHQRFTIERYDGREVADLAFMQALALYVLLYEDKNYAIQYATKTMAFVNFNKFRISETDMYLTYYLIMSDEEKAKDLINDTNNMLSKVNIDYPLLKKFFYEIKSGDVNSNFIKRFLLKLEGDLKIVNSKFRACRRIVQEWPLATKHQRHLVITTMLHFFRLKSKRLDMMIELEKLSSDDK